MVIYDIMRFLKSSNPFNNEKKVYMSTTLEDLLNTKYRRSVSESPYSAAEGSLILESSPFPAELLVYTAPRKGEALAAEYFASEVLAAVGLPTPFSVFVETSSPASEPGLAGEVFTHMISRQVCSNLDTGEVDLSYQFLDKGVLTQFIVDAVLQNTDEIAVTADNQGVEHDLRIVRVTYDWEHASARVLQKDKCEEQLRSLKERTRRLCSVTGDTISSTSEQELSMVVTLRRMKEDGTLSGIFHNPRVGATDQFKPLIDSGFLKRLEEAWASNIDTLWEHYSSKHDIKAFEEREKIREEFSVRIILELTSSFSSMTSYFNSAIFKQELMEKLRSSEYLEHPEDLEKNKSDPALFSKIVAKESARASLVKLSQNCDGIILKGLLDPFFVGNQSKLAHQFYREKTKFLKKIVGSKFNKEESRPLSEAEMKETTADFESWFFKELRAAKRDIKKEQLIAALLGPEVALIEPEKEKESLLTKWYGSYSEVDAQEFVQTLLQGLDEFRKHLPSEIEQRLFQDKPTKFESEADRSGLEDDPVFDMEAARQALLLVKRKYVKPPSYPLIESSFGFFRDEVPEREVDKSGFLEKEIDFLFDRINAEIDQYAEIFISKEQWKVDFSGSFRSLQNCYEKARNFLGIADKRFADMATKLGLPEKDIKIARERLEKRKIELHQKWHARAPELREKMLLACLNSEVRASRFLSNLFPAGENTGLAAFSPLDASLRTIDMEDQFKPDFITTDTTFCLSIISESPRFNAALGDVCVEYYRDLFRAYAGGEPIPNISLILPETDSQFDATVDASGYSNGSLYLLKIEFENATQKYHFFRAMCDDCYCPELGWASPTRMNINPESGAASVKRRYLKRLSEEGRVLIVPTTQVPQAAPHKPALTFSQQGSRVAVAGASAESFLKEEGDLDMTADPEGMKRIAMDHGS